MTHRPLALASALAKVWQQGIDGPRLAGLGAAPLLIEVGAPIHARIERLLASPGPAKRAQRSRAVALGVSASGLIALAVVQGANLAIALALMGCNPVALLRGLY